MSYATAPGNMILHYQFQIKGIDATLPSECGKGDTLYKVGDWVWVRSPQNRCIYKYQMGRIIDIVSSQAVEVRGMPCHVKALHLFLASNTLK